MITNVSLDWRVNQVGDGRRRAHSCSLLRHGTLDELCSAYTRVRMFSTNCRSETLTNNRNPNLKVLTLYWGKQN